LAYVKLGEQFIYLGAHGSPESRVAYERVVAEWLGRGRVVPPRRVNNGHGPSVNEMLLTYWKFARSFYCGLDGTPTLELDKLAQSIMPLKTLYGETDAADFGPVALKAVRQKMIDAGLARTTVNQRINCIRRIFKWAVGEELLPPMIFMGFKPSMA